MNSRPARYRLDIPSGFDSTSGDTPGVAIQPHRTLTLALPKIGLAEVPGEIYVADIGIPPGSLRAARNTP